MAVTVGNIIIGPGDVATGTTFAEGTSAAIANATGLPSTGTHIGATESDARVQLGFDLYDAAINEFHTAPLSILQNQWIEFGFTIVEITPANLTLATNDFGPAGVAYWGDVSLPAQAATDTSYCYVVPTRTANTFFVLGIYKGYCVNATELTVASMQGMAMINIPFTVRAHPDTSYTTTANLGYIDPAKVGA